MGWLKRRVNETFDRSGRAKPITVEERQVFLTLATGLLGRDAAPGSSFDDDVRAAIAIGTSGAEAAALTSLARSVADRNVAISIDELSAFGRCARIFGVAEDEWTFLGACVAR